MSSSTSTTAPVTAGSEKSPARRIVLDRATGPHGCLGAVTLEGPDVWAAACDQLRTWSLTAPDAGGYDKVDFTVTFANEFEYTGRFDIDAHGSCDLAEHIRATAAFFADPENTRHADHIDNAAWQNVLDTLQLGD